MDDKLQGILDSLPPKSPRSRLEPYSDLIHEMRRRSRTYREIARVLAEKCELRVATSTLHDFVRVRTEAHEKQKKRTVLRPPSTRSKTAKPSAATPRPPEALRARAPETQGELQRRIAALKKRSTSSERDDGPFHYDANEPLRLRPRIKKGRSGAAGGICDERE